MGFQFALQNWPCNCCVMTSIYLVGQRSRLPTPRQSRDRLAVSHGAVHASVFILPNKPQNLKLTLHLFSENTHHHHLCLSNSQEPNSATTIPRELYFQLFSKKKNYGLLAFEDMPKWQPQNCKHTHT